MINQKAIEILNSYDTNFEGYEAEDIAMAIEIATSTLESHQKAAAENVKITTTWLNGYEFGYDEALKSVKIKIQGLLEHK